jgi:dipeptidyl-peptidase-3
LFSCIVCGLLALAGCAQKTTTTAASESGTAQPSALVERVGSTGFLQIEASSFRGLQPRQQALAYWLTEAAIAIDPIIYDQMSRWGLRQKRLLEALVAHPQGIRPEVIAKITAFTKLFWANRGNHNDTTAQKFLPDFTFDELKEAGAQLISNGVQIGDPYGADKPIRSQADLMAEITDLRPSLFDPDFEPLVVAKSPQGGLDILQASANNFYFNVLLSDLKGFHERYPLNSRLVKMPGGKLVEQVYRAGTPDSRVQPGLYA